MGGFKMYVELSVNQDYEVMLPKAMLVRAKAKGSGIGTSWSGERFLLPVGAIITYLGQRKSILCGSVQMPFFSIESSGFGSEAGSDMGGVASFEGFFEPNSWGYINTDYLQEWE